MVNVDPEMQEMVSMLKKMKSEAEAEVQQEAASIRQVKKRALDPEGEGKERKSKVPRIPCEYDSEQEVGGQAK